MQQIQQKDSKINGNASFCLRASEHTRFRLERWYINLEQNSLNRSQPQQSFKNRTPTLIIVLTNVL